VYEAPARFRLVATGWHSVICAAAFSQAGAALRRGAAEESWTSGVRNRGGPFYCEKRRPRRVSGRETATAYQTPAAERRPPRRAVERRPVLCGGLFQNRTHRPRRASRGVWHGADVPLVVEGYLESAECGTVSGAAAAVDRPARSGRLRDHWLQQPEMVGGKSGPAFVGRLIVSSVSRKLSFAGVEIARFLPRGRLLVGWVRARTRRRRPETAAQPPAKGPGSAAPANACRRQRLKVLIW